MTDWVFGIVFLALFCVLVLAMAVMVFRRRRKVEPLPDGDYTVTMIGTHETPQGVATVFKVDSPEQFKGRTVTVVRGSDDGQAESDVDEQI